MVIDAANAMSARKLPGRHQDWVTDIAFSRDGRWMATIANDGSLKLWATATWRERATLRAHRTAAQSVAFHPAGTRIVVGTTDAISVWDTDGLRELTTIAGPKAGGVTRLHFLDEDARRLDRHFPFPSWGRDRHLVRPVLGAAFRWSAPPVRT